MQSQDIKDAAALAGQVHRTLHSLHHALDHLAAQAKDPMRHQLVVMAVPIRRPTI